VLRARHGGLDAGLAMMRWTQQNFARAGVRRWLQAAGSLSARLAAVGSSFSVQVVDQGRAPLTIDEAAALGHPGQRAGYIREVLLRVDGEPRVLARSVTAFADAHGAWRSLRGLGTRPLADVLFKRLGIERAPLSYAKFKPTTAAQRAAHKQWTRATGEPLTQRVLPARRSAFRRGAAALLVMEIFVAPEWHWSGAARHAKTGHRRRT